MQTQVFQTIVGGTFVAVLGLVFNQLLGHSVFMPLDEYRAIRKKIAGMLATWNPTVLEIVGPASFVPVELNNEFGTLVSEVRAFIPQRTWLLFWLPDRKKLSEVADLLAVFQMVRGVEDGVSLVRFFEAIGQILRLEGLVQKEADPVLRMRRVEHYLR